jgi:hypothetical protein
MADLHFYSFLSNIKFYKIVIVILIVSSSPNLLHAQDSLKHKKDKKLVHLIDTLLIDKDRSHWSVRAVTSYKDNRFNLSNSDNTLQYTPNNRTGVGIGIATSKIIADIVLNIKSSNEEQTERFDFQGNVQIKQNMLSLQVQNYQGYNVRNTTTGEPEIFRKDIRTFTTSLSFMHMFNSNTKTLSSIYSGLNMDNKSSGTFLAGIYVGYFLIQADSSIVPESSKDLFNQEAHIEQLNQFSFGVAGGYGYYLALPKNFFILLALTPGLGMGFQNIQTESLSYSPQELWEIYLYLNLSMGYNGSRIYVELSDKNKWNYVPLGNGNNGLTNATNLKLAFGWKIKGKKK